MIPGSFAYVRPGSIEQAVALLHEHGEDARLLAGGQSLLPLLKLRLAGPRVLIDIGRLAGLDHILEEESAIRIGALVTHAEIERSDLLRARLPLLPEAASRIGDTQVRNRGTIGGSLAHAHPAADFSAVMLALEAQMIVQGPEGTRTLAATDFFVGMFSTALRSDDVLVEVRIPPLPTASGTAYVRADDKASHFAVAGIAAVIGVESDGSCRSAGIGVTGVAVTPFRARAVEAALRNRALDRPAVEAAARTVTDGIEPLSDPFASGEYRAHLAKVCAAQAILEAAGRVVSWDES